MLVYALVVADIDWTVGRVLAIPVAIAAGTLIYGAVWIALATVAFWIVDAIEFVNAFTYGGNFLSQYPIGIFARWLQGLVVFLVPVAFVAYFPRSTSSTRRTSSGCRRPSSTSRRSSRCSPSSPRAVCGGTPCAGTGAPVADAVIEVEAVEKQFVAAGARRDVCAASAAS